MGRPYEQDPTATFEVWALQKDPTELGRLLKEYVAESNHNGWDGFSSRDLTGIRRLLTDMAMYYDSTVGRVNKGGWEGDSDHFKKLSSVNPL